MDKGPDLNLSKVYLTKNTVLFFYYLSKLVIFMLRSTATEKAYQPENTKKYHKGKSYDNWPCFDKIVGLRAGLIVF